MMRIEVTKKRRPERHDSFCQCQVTDDGTIIFQPGWAAIRFDNADAAQWFGDFVCRTYRSDRFRPPPGHPANTVPMLDWKGDMRDDCTAETEDFYAHAEWCQGAMWYCQITDRDDGRRVFHSADHALQIRKGGAARWLCELVISAANKGIVP